MVFFASVAGLSAVALQQTTCLSCSFFYFTAPQRTSCTLTIFKQPAPVGEDELKVNGGKKEEQPPLKRQRRDSTNMNGSDAQSGRRTAEDLMMEAGRFAVTLACTIDQDTSS
jgi:hypothetical protein